MERFRNIDWNPALEDIIDEVFIRDERMERESVMYQIMHDNYKDPFEDIENDYDDVDIEQIKKYLREDDENIPDFEDKKLQKAKNGDERPYVPGIRTSFRFPRQSYLNKAEQACCLRVILRLSNKESTSTTNGLKESREYHQYLDMQEIISKEQKEFLEFAMHKWDDTFKWSIKCMKFIAKKWKAKMRRFQTKLPRYYVELKNIPLSVQKINFQNKEIKVTAISCLRQSTAISELTLPLLDRPYMLNMEPEKLLEKYPPCNASNKVTKHFELPVSEDTCCESLAIETGADFVISSSGLKCLMSNVDPNHSTSWLIPVVVKSHHGKNTVYVDKRLPPTIATVPQKNTWVYKYILRDYFTDVKNKAKHMKEDKLEEKAGNYSDTESDLANDHLKIYEEDLYSLHDDLYLSDEDKSEKSSDPASDKVDSKIDEQQNVSYNLKTDEPGKSDDLASSKTDSEIDTQKNVFYNFFKIGPVASLDYERIKTEIKEYKMLVRTKIDGKEMLSNGHLQSLILAPKMEHQLSFGAEATTLEEGLHQWASLKFNPKTSLARVRIAADTSEVIQIEKHTLMSLGVEIKRLYNVKVEDSLSILHNIIEGLSSLTPGQYIMQHIPQSGPFAYVYKQADYRKDAFDLHTICQSATFETTPKTPWPPIDIMMTTPAIKCFQRMPAMFRPNNHPNKFLGRRRKKNDSVTKSQVSESLRRSGRLQNTT
ncbi:uncharacterized protein LOC105838508 [Monomorium pharaonis]|uniref:uncharacterized protein LOC105838508 n=1 Tax=Monomorium pharaonis TaxID=307658 RepID=UPI00102E1446|nr:uncharacterized protein LOC105838508 [Monomorium pharaonis]XP_028050350.1 uncharacterized protein LOC105838508 [Monomorium pharaonis]